MTELQQLISLQEKEGYTNLEMETMLEIPEKTWESWKGGRRKPSGPALSLIKHTLEALKGKPITKADLLIKTGRYAE